MRRSESGQSATFETEVVRPIGSQHGRSGQVVQHCAATDPAKPSLAVSLKFGTDCRLNSRSLSVFANGLRERGELLWNANLAFD